MDIAKNSHGGKKHQLPESLYGRIAAQCALVVFACLVLCASALALEDTTPPQLTLVTGIKSPAYDTSPVFSFLSTEAGKIVYAGACSAAASNTSAKMVKTVVLNPLAHGAYSNCTVSVRDAGGNVSSPLFLGKFIIGPVPVLASISPEYLVAGNKVLLSGQNLADANVSINDINVSVTDKTTNSIVFVVPDIPQGSYKLSLGNAVGSVAKNVYIKTGLQAASVSAGNNHSCAITLTRRVECWGDNFFGQLGNNTLLDASLPVSVKGVSAAVSVSAGARHSCAALANGTIRCWGDNQYGQLGNGATTDSAVPVVVGGIVKAVAVSSGTYHSCALLSDATVWCWGANYTGQLGSGIQLYFSLVPVMVKGINTAIAVSNGDEYSCALLADKTVKCWGDNSHGELGNATLVDSYIPTPVSGLDNVMDIATGTDVACASRFGGDVQCWGGYDTVQAAYITMPQAISGINNAQQIDMGNYRACAVLQDSTVTCWESNYTAATFTLNPLAMLADVRQVNVGGGHVCAVLADNSVKCWGLYDNGQSGKLPSYQYKNYDAVFPYNYPGARSVSVASKPVTVEKLGNIKSVSEGGYHKCAVLLDGTVQCLGNNRSGQLGDGNVNSLDMPVKVAGIEDAIAVSVSSEEDSAYSCVIHADATVSCWGDNHDSHLGNPLLTETHSVLPMKVEGIAGAEAISVGEGHACVKLKTKAIKCWGNNQSGQLGNGSNSRWGRAVTVYGINNAVDVKAGAYHSCALLETGTVSCWGDNKLGQLGNGTVMDSFIPVPVMAMNNVTAISAGYEHSCAVMANGMIQCWGNNSKGQLGNNSIAGYATIPFPVYGVVDAAAVSLGGNHTCALLKSDQVSCWGYGKEGQLGSGQLFDRNKPANVSGIYNVKMIELGTDNSCALLKNGALQCWGYDARQLMTAPNAPVL